MPTKDIRLSIMQHLMTKIKSDSRLKTMLRHTGIMYASGLFSTLLIIIQQISTASLLGPAEYGRLAAVLASGSLIMLIVDVRTWEVGTKLLAHSVNVQDNSETAQVITWLTIVDLITGLLGAVVVFVLAPLIATHLLHAPALTWLVALYALSIPFRMLANGIARTTLRVYDRFGLLSLKSLIYGIARIVLISGAALVGLGLEGAIIGAILAEVIGTTVLLGMQVIVFRAEAPDCRLIDLRRPKQFDYGMKMMKGLWFSATFAGLQLELFVPVLALLTTPDQVGLFRSGLDVAEIVEKLLIPFMLVMYPQVMQTYETGNRSAFVQLIKQSAVLMGLMTLPIVLAVLLAGPFVLPRLLGSGYNDASTVASLIALGFTVYGILMWTRPALIAFSRIRELNLIGFATAILTTLALLAIAPSHGAIGAATVRGLGLAAQNFLMLALFRNAFIHQRFPKEQILSSI